MRYLGLDLGNRTVGMAMSDQLGLIANPLTTYKFSEKDLQKALEYVKIVVFDHQVDTVVLGFPKNMDGSIGFQAQYVLEFKKMLEDASIKVELIDERLTTMQVNKIMLEADISRQKRKQHVDKLAAVVILQNYLDRMNRK